MAIATWIWETAGRHQRLTNHGLRLASFSMVGGVGVVVNNGLLFLLVERGHMNVILAGVLATEAAIINNFVLNDAFTFRGVNPDKSYVRRLISYNGLTLGGLVISVATLGFLHYVLGVHYLVANVLSIAPGMLWNYASNHRWTWSRRRTSS
ncbi:MAG TPA: GtrA family protein [Candidatus Dormibacteraeota bacterium]